MSLKTVKLISGVIGFVTALLFVMRATLRWQYPISENLSLIGLGILASVMGSIFNVNWYEELKGGNDAGAMRNSSYIFGSVGGGVLFGIYFAMKNHVSIQHAIRLIGQGILGGLGAAITTWIVLLICFIPLLLVNLVLKINIVEKYFVRNETAEQIFGAIMTSVSIMILWSSLAKGELFQL